MIKTIQNEELTMENIHCTTRGDCVETPEMKGKKENYEQNQAQSKKVRQN